MCIKDFNLDLFFDEGVRVFEARGVQGGLTLPKKSEGGGNRPPPLILKISFNLPEITSD